MLKAIRTRFYGATNTRPRRVIASDADGHTFTLTDGMTDNVEGQYESMHELAAKGLMTKMKWDNEIVGGGYGNEQFWVMMPKRTVPAENTNPEPFKPTQFEARPLWTPKPDVTYIDFTPPGLKTPDGSARVNAALKEWDDATAAVANAIQHWMDAHGSDVTHVLRQHGDFGAALDDIHQLTALIGARSRKQDAFLKAVAGQ